MLKTYQESENQISKGGKIIHIKPSLKEEKETRNGKIFHVYSLNNCHCKNTHFR